MAEGAQPIRVVVDYAPVKGKRSVCFLVGCDTVIERGHLRIKEEYLPSAVGGELLHRYHIECYPYPIVVDKLEGLDKIKEEDRRKVIFKAGPPDPSSSNSSLEENEDEENEGEDEDDEGEYEEESDEGTVLLPEKDQKEPETDKALPESKVKYRNGSRIMAKVQGNVARNIWFLGKVLNSRISASGQPEYHVCYLEDNMKDVKEWVPERFLAPPVVEDEPTPSTFTQGSIALGWRRKPGASHTLGWWYSVKVLRYLRDVPGAFVHWSDFPFPDSILEAGKMHLTQPQEDAKAIEVPQQKGVKRQMTENEGEALPKKEKLT